VPAYWSGERFGVLTMKAALEDLRRA